MNDHNKEQQLRFLEEVCTCLHRAGFETQPLEDSQLPVYWNGVPLCRITGKGSVFYRREDADTPQAEDALYRAEDIAAKTPEYACCKYCALDNVMRYTSKPITDSTTALSVSSLVR